MADEDIRNLPPEERIKKLKELEEKRKKEIEEAHALIKQSEEELTERRKWKEKVPIPEFASEDLQELSEEAKEILRTERGLKDKRRKSVSTGSGEESGKKGRASLEETLSDEEIPIQMRKSAEQAARDEFFAAKYERLSEKPMGELYQEAVALKETIAEKGYISREDERRAEYIANVAAERMESDTYSFTEETARQASLTQMIGADIRSVYQRRAKGQERMYKA
ncbi:MAG: hypothetical protein AB1668_03975 [Nanoarchaeota archaeon]